jgi:hypothetical protein
MLSSIINTVTKAFTEDTTTYKTYYDPAGNKLQEQVINTVKDIFTQRGRKVTRQGSWIYFSTLSDLQLFEELMNCYRKKLPDGKIVYQLNQHN